MADSCITISFDREDRERIDALTHELAKLSALLAGQARGEGCGRCGSVGASTTVEHRFNDWQASRRAVVSDEPR